MSALHALLRRFTIRMRMWGAIGLVLSLLALIGGMGLLSLGRMQAAADEFEQGTRAQSQAVAAMQAAMGDLPETALHALHEALAAQAAAQAAAQRAQRQAVARDAYVLFAVTLLVGALLVVPLTLANMESICQPIDRAQALADRIAAGDLTTTVHDSGRDEAARLSQALSHMQTSLRGIVAQVRESAGSIEMASAEVASGNQDLSHRTEQAASSLQQTAASMQQLTGTVQQNTQSAAQADQLAAGACAVARRGGAAVSQVVRTMEEIAASSQRIADITGVIDGIAFQTNILALNAAVEAARAGEQGRGFAVVAGEVRSLAQRAAEAAKEIKTLIVTSVERVNTGATLVKDAGATMDEIVAGVQRVSQIIGEISVSAREQGDGIGQIGSAVSHLDRMTQENAALVEQAAAAADALKSQSHTLTQIVAGFRLGTS